MKFQEGLSVTLAGECPLAHPGRGRRGYGSPRRNNPGRRDLVDRISLWIHHRKIGKQTIRLAVLQQGQHIRAAGTRQHLRVGNAG